MESFTADSVARHTGHPEAGNGFGVFDGVTYSRIGRVSRPQISRELRTAGSPRTKIHAERLSNGLCNPASDKKIRADSLSNG